MAQKSRQNLVEALIRGIRHTDDPTRAEAWFGAGAVGAPAVGPLGSLLTDRSTEVARAAKNGLCRIARHAGRPGAEAERRSVVAELVALLSHGRPAVVRREVAWMLSEIAGDEAVEPLAALLKDQEVREDARMALERIPGKESLAALQAALSDSPNDFRLSVAQSLRRRGVEVAGLSCQKLVPTAPTGVGPEK